MKADLALKFPSSSHSINRGPSSLRICGSGSRQALALIFLKPDQIFDLRVQAEIEGNRAKLFSMETAQMLFHSD